MGRQPQRAPDGAPVHYERHRPEQTTLDLDRLVQQSAARFIAHTEASTGTELPRFIKDEFDAFLECSILAHGFLRLHSPQHSLAKCRPVPGDRRFWGVHLKPRALPLIAEVQDIVLEMRAGMLVGLTPEQRRGLSSTLLAVKANLSKALDSEMPVPPVDESESAVA